jgi:nicotinamide mononucleotide transporter
METGQIIELISAISCLLSIWLNTKRKSAGWPVGLFSVILASWVYYQAGLLAECGLQCFYFTTGIYGWWQWSKSENESSEGKILVERLGNGSWILGLILALLLSWIIWLILLQFPRAGSPMPDALITGLSLLAQLWLAKRKLENWIMWIMINLGSVLLYLQRELWFFAVLYSMLFLIAIRGYRDWKKQLP